MSREGLVSEILSHPDEMLAGGLQDRWVDGYANVCVVNSVCVCNMLHVTCSCICLCVHLRVGRRRRQCDQWPLLS